MQQVVLERVDGAASTCAEPTVNAATQVAKRTQVPLHPSFVQDETRLSVACVAMTHP